MVVFMEKIFNAKTLDEAKALAAAFYAQHGIGGDEIDYEIIEQPVKKLFGTKGEYRVRAAAEVVEAEAEIIEEKAAVVEAVEQPDEALGDEKFGHVVRYLTRILQELGAEGFHIEIKQREDMTVLDIVGDKLGIAIGRRGETLDSLQYLAILANNRSGEQYSRLSVDCNGYREKRRETLESLATRTAHKVAKQGRRVTLEPMNPYERRIIHSKVAEIEGVFSNSIGEEPYRKVVISANVPKPRTGPRPERGDNRNDRGRNDRRGNPNAGKSYKQSSGFSTSFEREYKRAPSENVEISEDTVEVEKTSSLFDKIEL